MYAGERLCYFHGLIGHSQSVIDSFKTHRYEQATGDSHRHAGALLPAGLLCQGGGRGHRMRWLHQVQHGDQLQNHQSKPRKLVRWQRRLEQQFFRQICKVKLLTKERIVKYTTESSPVNGYYMIPIYNKGEYILQVNPPPGWSFGKRQQQLLVELKRGE